MTELIERFLVAFDVHRCPTGARPGPRSFELAQTDGQRASDRSIVVYAPGGDALSSSSVSVCPTAGRDLFGEVLGDGIVLSEDSGGYRTRIAFVSFTKKQAISLATGGYDAAQATDKLLKAVLPQERETIVFPDLGGVAYGKFIHLEYTAAAVDEELLLRDIQNEAGVTPKNLLPVLALDMLVLEAGHGTATTALTTVWLSRRSESDAMRREIAVSSTLLRLIEIIAAAAAMKDIASQLGRLPTSAEPVLTYLSTASRQAEPLAHYLAEHIRHREQATAAIVASEENLESLRAVRAYGVLDAATLVRTPDALRVRAYNPVSYLRYKLESAESSATAAVRRATRRDSVIADYLRDHVNAVVASTNLKVQDRVTWLTVVTVIVGLVAIVQELMPEDIKVWLWRIMERLLSV